MTTFFSPQEMQAFLKEMEKECLSETPALIWINCQVPKLLSYIRTLEKEHREMREAIINAKCALENFDNLKGGYEIPHSEYCMSQRTEVQEDMVTYGHGPMDVCDCYLNEALHSIEECEKVLSSLTLKP